MLNWVIYVPLGAFIRALCSTKSSLKIYTAEAWILLPFTNPSILRAVSNRLGNFLISLANSVTGLRSSSTLPYRQSWIDQVKPLVIGIKFEIYCAASLSIPSPLAAVNTADLLPSVLKVQQLRTFLSPFLCFTASIIWLLRLRWESISTVYTVTFVIFKRTRLSHYPMSIHRLAQTRTSRMWHYGNGIAPSSF